MAVLTRRRSRQVRQTACTKFTGAQLVDGAGHWVQQEQPARVTDFLLAFLRGTRG
ncbi:MAG: alpha/beta hydrolase [Acidobacteria bacterium]|nr:alpha/beta hydrolase [Acidobacteriota bacterium]